MAFDIQLNMLSGKQWMNYDDAMAVMKAAGIPFCVPLKRGTLAECYAFNTEINSTIPKLLGLPELKKNQMEGIVIKSVNNYLMPKARGEYQPRAIFKKKNAKFGEVNPPCKTQYELKREQERNAEREIFDNLERYVRNENRVHSVESKLGPLTTENSKEIADALAVDGLKDYVKDFEEFWNKLTDDVKERVTKSSKYVFEFLQHVIPWLSCILTLQFDIVQVDGCWLRDPGPEGLSQEVSARICCTMILLL
jgi:Rnl2 family RNA ligase